MPNFLKVPSDELLIGKVGKGIPVTIILFLLIPFATNFLQISSEATQIVESNAYSPGIVPVNRSALKKLIILNLKIYLFL